MTNWRCSALVVCPYYLRENERFVVCEWVVDGVEMSLHFDDQARKIAYQSTTNPGGVGHGWVKERFITPAPPMTPIVGQYEIVTPDGAQAQPPQRGADARRRR